MYCNTCKVRMGCCLAGLNIAIYGLSCFIFVLQLVSFYFSEETEDQHAAEIILFCVVSGRLICRLRSTQTRD